MAEKEKAEAAVDEHGLQIQRYVSMVLVVVPPRDYAETTLRYARSALYNVHLGTRSVSTDDQSLIKGVLQDEFQVDGPIAGETMEAYSGLILVGGPGAPARPGGAPWGPSPGGGARGHVVPRSLDVLPAEDDRRAVGLDAHPALLRPELASDEPEQGALPCPVLADQTGPALGEHRADSVEQRKGLMVAEGHPFESNAGHSRLLEQRGRGPPRAHARSAGRRLRAQECVVMRRRRNGAGESIAVRASGDNPGCTFSGTPEIPSTMARTRRLCPSRISFASVTSTAVKTPWAWMLPRRSARSSAVSGGRRSAKGQV